MIGVNETPSSSGSVIYWALNGYGVTGFDLFINMFIILLAVWIIGLNLLVLHTLLRVAPSREPTDMFVCSLAVADTLSGVFLLYNTSYNLANYQIFHECALRMGIIQIVGLSSVFHMSALTVDRYIKIVKPYHYSTVCNKMSVMAVSVTIWTICLIIGFLPLMGWHSNSQPNSTDLNQEPLCGFFVVFHQMYLKLLVSLFWCPFLLMIVLYLHIFKIARRHARLIAVQDSRSMKERHSWKYTKTVCLIIGIYFISWLPSANFYMGGGKQTIMAKLNTVTNGNRHVHSIIGYMCLGTVILAGVVVMLDFGGDLGNRTTVEKGTLLLYVSSIALLNSLVNPIIYAFKITSVRLRFNAVFCRKTMKLSEIEASQTEAAGYRVPMSRIHVTKLASTVICEIDD